MSRHAFFKINSDENHYKLTWFCRGFFNEFQKMNNFTVFLFRKITENHKNRENFRLQNFLHYGGIIMVLWYYDSWLDCEKCLDVHRYKVNAGYVITNSPKFTHGPITLNSKFYVISPWCNLMVQIFTRIKLRAQEKIFSLVVIFAHQGQVSILRVLISA